MTSEKKYSNLIIDMGLFAVGALGSKLILFLLVPLYTNVLTDSEYGIADLVFSVSDLLLPLLSLAIYNGLLRFGLIPNKQQTAIKNTWIVFTFGVVCTIIVTPLVGLYKPVGNYKWLLSLKIIATYANSNSMICLKIKGKNKAFAIISILQAILLVSFNVLFLVYYQFGIIGYLLSTIISLFVAAIVAFWYSKALPDIISVKYDNKLMKDMIIYSAPFIANDISWWLVHSSDKVMIEWIIDSSLLGIYTASTKIPSLINSITSIFSQAWGIASIKEFDTTNDTVFYSRVFKYFSISIFGICAIIIAITKPFMNVYLGKDFNEAWHYVPLLLASACFAAVSIFSGSLFGALKKTKDLMGTTIVSALANIIVNALLIPICGVWGAVAGTVVAYVIVALSRMVVLHKHIMLDYSLKLFVPICIVLLVEAVLIGFDYHVVPVGIMTIVIIIIIIRKEIRPLISFAQSSIRNRIK